MDRCLASIKAKLLKKKKEPRLGEPGGFVVGKHVYFLRVQPSAQNNNLDDYRYVLSEVGLLDGLPKPGHCGVRRIYKAYDFFRSEVPATVEKLCQLTEKISQLNVVQITVDSQSDAFTLFESLNYRGVPLSAIDIIKNKMLAEMEKQGGHIDEAFERWQKLINALPDVTEQERFLRHFYNAFKHRDGIRVEGVSRAAKSQIIRIYHKLIGNDAKGILKELTEMGQLYGSLLRPPEEWDAPRRQGLEDLQRIGAAPAYQLLLFLWSIPSKQLAPADFLNRAVDLLSKYYVRRNITDFPATRDLDAATIEVIEDCVKKIGAGKNLAFDDLSKALLKGQGKPAPLEEFKTALGGPIYWTNAWMARYLLIQIDHQHHSREYCPELWAEDAKGRFVWTVEHVLPQTDHLPTQWVEMIADGDAEEAAVLQERWVDCLGNLTLSGYNSDLATSPFEKKQHLAKNRMFLGHKINIGYRNGLALNKLPFRRGGRTLSLADAPEWTVEMIESRTKAMIELIVKANALSGE